VPDRVELTHNAIEPAALLAGLAESRDGAVDLFLGVVRDHHDGRRVLRLEYHAYPEMALKVMGEIAAEGHARFAVSSLALVHRLGTLEVGEISVALAVAAPHRQAAFDACRHAMERVKREVPIWKREQFEDGAAWVLGCAPDPDRPRGSGA
jgi:molybdopterin synthase catalytic subunit